MANNGTTNGSTNGAAPTVEDIELQMCSAKDKIISLVTQEDTLRELKAEAAKEFRDQIKGVKDARRKAEKDLLDLQNGILETEGSVIIQNAEPSAKVSN